MQDIWECRRVEEEKEGKRTRIRETSDNENSIQKNRKKYSNISRKTDQLRERNSRGKKENMRSTQITQPLKRKGSSGKKHIKKNK